MTEPLEDDVIPSSGVCPTCGEPTYDFTPNGRPDLVGRCCLECGYERMIPLAQPDSATDERKH